MVVPLAQEVSPNDTDCSAIWADSAVSDRLLRQHAMRVYVVGGAVRDELLGLPVKDCDYVVVGATPEHMIEQGFKPVGRDFPVFLHPATHEEYALARTERKTAPGYQGFTFHASPEVTLEEDLARRDLTINAMARAVEIVGVSEARIIIDPFGGRRDLEARVFRHVGPAFAEDPVRILRVARFAARFADFTVAPETLTLMQGMVVSGEVDALVPERVWQEIARGLMEDAPARCFALLREVGALARVAPQLAALPADGAAFAALQAAVRLKLSLEARIAALVHGFGEEAIQALATRLRFPADVRDLALLMARTRETLLQAAVLDAAGLVDLFHRSDAYRQRERFFALCAAAHCVAEANGADFKAAVKRLNHALAAASGVDGGAIARTNPQNIPEALRRARLEAVLRAS